MADTLLVTGGLGFIGSHFVRLVLREWPGVRVVNLDKMTYAGNPENLAEVADHPAYVFVKGDIADRATVESVFSEHRPRIVVNFAAESHVDRSILDARPFLATNVAGVQMLLEGSRSQPVERFVQISTDEVYGDIPPGAPPADEDAPLRPSSPYSASKAAADLLCLAYARTYGVPIVIVRPSNNFGPNQFPEKLIPLMIRNALAGETLPVYGEGEQMRDWIYVEDAARGIARVVREGCVGAVYNVSTGEERPNIEVVRRLCQIIAEQAGRDPAETASGLRFVPDRPGHDRRYATVPRRIREELGWRPSVPFEEGLVRTVRWYLSHPGWVERVVSGEYLTYYQAVYDRRWETVGG